MKRIAIIISCLLMTVSYAQESIEDLLTAGINDTEQFLQSYLDPATDGLVYNLNNGWFNSGKSKKLFGFEIALVANASFVKDGNDTFVLDINDYENLRFQDPTITQQRVSTAFGDVEGVSVIVEGPGGNNAVFDLPTGLGSADINFIPSAFIQASVGLIKGVELKARFFPKVETDDVEAGLFGVGLQYDFTSLLPADKLIPIAISGLVAYTNLDATYDFSESSIVSGSDQRLENSTTTWLFQAIGSTRLPVFNVYGGIGYITGNSDTDLRGTYNVTSGAFAGDTLVDPLSIENSVSGVRGTLGIKLKVGFFRFNADYTLAEFDNLSVGISFGFR